MYYLNYYKKKLKASIQVSNRPKSGHYPQIGILNPTIGSNNLGDIIINDAVNWHLKGMYNDAFFTNFPTHLYTSLDSQFLMAGNDLLFVSGTNLLSSNMDQYFQWNIGPSHKRSIKNKVVLMGVGWWQYQATPNSYTKKLLNAVLSKTALHSVRDQYTLEMLRSIGIKNVLNTSCPTLWNITEEFCRTVPSLKADCVVTTLTFYKKDRIKDALLLKILEENFKTVYLWIQGIGDYDYLKEIYPAYENIKLIPPTLHAYNNLLEEQQDVEYIGTRLHAGIRALQKGVRTMILAVDNRAVEIGRDTNLNVIKRDDIEKLSDYICSSYRTNVIPPLESINKWKASYNIN